MYITSKYPLLQEEEDFFLLSSIIFAGDVSISLPKRLHIVEDVYVTGSLESDTDIVTGGAFVIYGQLNSKSIQAKTLKALGRNMISGDLLTSESCIIGATHIEGSVITHNKLLSVSTLNVLGDIGINGEGDICFDLKAKGRIAVNGVLDCKGYINCSEMKVNSKKISRYGRVLSNKTNAIFYDRGFSVKVPGEGWVFVESEDVVPKMLSDDKLSIIAKEALKDTISLIQISDDITFTLERWDTTGS